MAFCKFSNECILDNSTQVDNIFISQFLPGAPDVCTKVYLYGLYKCANPNAFNNSLEAFSVELGLSAEDIENAFLYWQDLGLVDIIMGTNFQVRYIPLKNVINTTRKFSKSKYADFNKKAQEIIEGRMITATEYTEYYTIMEVYNIEPKALLLIMDYCTEIKGKNVGYSYITTVARNWACEGITTYESVVEKIKTYNGTSPELAKLLKLCGIKRMASVDEYDKFLKWTNDLDFPLESILYVAESIYSKQGKLSFNKLDSKLATYYETKKITVEEIESFENAKTEMFNLAKTICKNIGVYYNDLEIVVEKYISKWLDLGHTEDSLITLAEYCFKNSIRSLEGLDTVVMKLYKLGIISSEAIQEHLLSLLEEDNEIKTILSNLGLSRHVNSQDREFLKTWKFSWNISKELLNFAVEKSVGKSMPMQYLNKILSNWHNDNITTLAEAQKVVQNSQTFDNTKSLKAQKSTIELKRHFSKEDLCALFTNLDEVEL